MRGAATLAAATVAGLASSACETTMDKAARVRREGLAALRARHGLRVGALNRDVRVLDRAIVRDRNGTAVVLELENTAARAQARVPVGIELLDARGRRVFANDAPGLEPALVSVPLLPRGRQTFWVHNQITATAPARRLQVTVGRPAPGPVPLAPPHITLSGIRLEHDQDGAFATGIVRNRSKVTQRRLTIFCVALRRGRVVAAGRAVVDRLPPSPTRKPIRFSVYFIGNPSGARLRFSVPPTVLR